MKKKPETEKTSVYLADPTPNASRARGSTGPNAGSETNQSQVMFADLIALLAIILLKQGYDSLRLREMALGAQ
jgi:hypothetical protein